MPEEMIPAVPNEGALTPSAPATENAAPATEPSPGENQVPNTGEPEVARTETLQDKTVPLKEHIDERTRRKQAEEYSRQLLKQLESTRPAQQPLPQNQTPTPQEYVVEADPSQFMTRQEYEFSQRESSGWSDAKAEYRDEFKQYPNLESIAEGVRQQTVLSGRGYMTPTEAVESILKDFRSERLAGQKAATQSVAVQSQAAIQGSGSKVDADAELVSTLKQGLESRDKRTRQASFQELLKRGVIP